MQKHFRSTYEYSFSALIPSDPGFSAPPFDALAVAVSVCLKGPARRDTSLPGPNRRDPARIRADSSGAEHRAGGPALIPPDPGFFSPPFDALFAVAVCASSRHAPHSETPAFQGQFGVIPRRSELIPVGLRAGQVAQL